MISIKIFTLLIKKVDLLKKLCYNLFNESLLQFFFAKERSTTYEKANCNNPYNSL